MYCTRYEASYPVSVLFKVVRIVYAYLDMLRRGPLDEGNYTECKDVGPARTATQHAGL